MIVVRALIMSSGRGWRALGSRVAGDTASTPVLSLYNDRPSDGSLLPRAMLGHPQLYLGAGPADMVTNGPPAAPRYAAPFLTLVPRADNALI